MEQQINNHKNIIEIATKGGALAVLLYVLVFFGNAYLQRMTEMQADLVKIRIDLTKIQSTLLTKDDIQGMIDSKM